MNKASYLYILSIFAITTITLSLYSCADDTNNSFENGDADGELSEQQDDFRAIAVVGSDYTSTSISIIDRKLKTLYAEGIIHSGSADPKLSTALSGDIVFPSTANPGQDIVLIDRYPNSVLTFLSPDDFTISAQLSVSTGFASNPHDYLMINEHKAYLTRYEKNPNPGETDFDQGDDILIIDSETLDLLGRIDFSNILNSDEGETHARPDRLLMIGDSVWVSFNVLGNDFKQVGTARLASIDTQTDTITDILDIPELANCSDMEYSEQHQALFLSCSGVFIDGLQSQLERSGIARIDLSGEDISYTVIRKGTQGAARPYGFDLDLASSRYLLALRFGDIDEGINDKLVAIDIEDYSEAVIHEASTPFGLGGFLADDTDNTLYIGDADLEHPKLIYYSYDNEGFILQGEIITHPNSGLPPKHLQFY